MRMLKLKTGSNTVSDTDPWPDPREIVDLVTQRTGSISGVYILTLVNTADVLSVAIFLRFFLVRMVRYSMVFSLFIFDFRHFFR